MKVLTALGGVKSQVGLKFDYPFFTTNNLWMSVCQSAFEKSNRWLSVGTVGSHKEFSKRLSVEDDDLPHNIFVQTETSKQVLDVNHQHL